MTVTTGHKNGKVLNAANVNQHVVTVKARPRAKKQAAAKTPAPSKETTTVPADTDKAGKDTKEA